MGIAAELMNFKDEGDLCYGYVAHFNTDETSKDIDLSHYNVGRQEDRVNGMTVVWIAPRKQKGKEVVGWYRNATVYRHAQFPKGDLAKARTHNSGGSKPMPYFAVCAVEDAVLLAPDQRTLLLASNEKGLPGQSRIYHPNKNIGKPAAVDMLKRVGSFMSDFRRAKKIKLSKKKRVDVEKNKHVEVEAIDCTTRYYRNDGYEVESVEADNLGYDLVAFKNGEVLFIEVKGRSGLEAAADFSPNEARTIRKAEKGKFKDGEYRICIVTNALSDERSLHEFRWTSRKRKAAWRSSDGHTLSMKEVMALRAKSKPPVPAPAPRS